MIVSDDLLELDAFERVKLIDEVHGDKALLLGSMQKTSGVLMHMIHRLKAKTVLLFVDTQFHFNETLAARDMFIERYGLDIVTVYPETTPEQQRRKYDRDLYNYVDGQPECCNIRKEKPFLKAARKMRINAVMNGLMAAEGGKRANLGPTGYDNRLDCINYHPIFDWSHEQVEDYIKEHDVPVHALYKKDYLSIGCEPCTTPVKPGEDRRAGRWRHLRDEDGNKPEYCEINFSDLGKGI